MTITGIDLRIIDDTVVHDIPKFKQQIDNILKETKT